MSSKQAARWIQRAVFVSLRKPGNQEANGWGEMGERNGRSRPNPAVNADTQRQLKSGRGQPQSKTLREFTAGWRVRLRLDCESSGAFASPETAMYEQRLIRARAGLHSVRHCASVFTSWLLRFAPNAAPSCRRRRRPVRNAVRAPEPAGRIGRSPTVSTCLTRNSITTISFVRNSAPNVSDHADSNGTTG
jgi:hypothetical protein